MKVLGITYFQRHLEKLLPVLRQLEVDNQIELVSLLLTPEEHLMAEEAGLPFRRFEEFADDLSSEQKDLWDKALIWALNAIVKESPDVVLMVEVNLIARQIIRYCREQRIRTLVVQHGLANRHSLIAFAPFEADIMAVWGEETRDFLVSQGVSAEKMVITGAPSFDNLVNYRVDREKLLEKLGLDSSKGLIVFTLQGPGAGGRPSLQELSRALEATCEAMLGFPDKRLVLKPHPNQALEPVLKIADRYRNSVIVTTEVEAKELIASCEIQITFFSSTALEGLVMGKNLILVNLSGEEDLLSYAKGGAAVGVYSVDEIRKCLHILVNQPTILKEGRESVLERAVSSLDCRASERVVSLVKQCSSKDAIPYKPSHYQTDYYYAMNEGVKANPVGRIHFRDVSAEIVGGTVLSIGCGTGINERWLMDLNPNLRIKGTDAFATPLQVELWEKQGLEVFQVDGCKQPFSDESFDTVYTMHVLEHVESPKRLILESLRVAKYRAIHLVPINLDNPDHIHFFRWDLLDNKFATQKATINLRELVDEILDETRNIYPAMTRRMEISCPRDGSYPNEEFSEFPIRRPDRPDGLMPCFLLVFEKKSDIRIFER